MKTGGIEGSAEAFGGDAGLGSALLSEQVEGDVTEDGEALGAVADSDAAVILVEGDIEHPVEAILHPPMAADRACQQQRVGRQAGAVVTGLGRDGGTDAAGGVDADDAAQALRHDQRLR